MARHSVATAGPVGGSHHSRRPAAAGLRGDSAGAHEPAARPCHGTHGPAARVHAWLWCSAPSAREEEQHHAHHRCHPRGASSVLLLRPAHRHFSDGFRVHRYSRPDARANPQAPIDWRIPAGISRTAHLPRLAGRLWRRMASAILSPLYFLERPNRFGAWVALQGRWGVCSRARSRRLRSC